MKKLLTQYIRKFFGDNYADDLQLALGKNFNILNMINPKTINHPDSEIKFRKKYLINKVHSSIDSSVEPFPEHQLRTGCPSSRFMFINGVVTPYALALHQSNMLSKAIGQEVELFHNETDGLIKDIIECNEGRYGILNTVAKEAISAIKDKLIHSGDLTIVAHSQGAIIITSALLEITKELPLSELSRIKFITFGAGFKESILPKEIHSEHFANINDPITHLGLQNTEHKFTGELYTREANGHFFVADYLIPIMDGQTYQNNGFELLITGEH